mmetsp:Transcript_14208/g.30494  ORF Transcript_14208/g.30494 Transcript_14208/m.30494 type:complete len:107 (-) Transcript_14208:268-588(-)
MPMHYERVGCFDRVRSIQKEYIQSGSFLFVCVSKCICQVAAQPALEFHILCDFKRRGEEVVCTDNWSCVSYFNDSGRKYIISTQKLEPIRSFDNSGSDNAPRRLLL